MPSLTPRIDGLPKVLGEKIYARDYRSRDLPGWPQDTHHALLIRAGVADRAITLDVSAIDEMPIRPLKIVTAADVAARAIRPAVNRKTFGVSWFVPNGAIAEHVAQPVAMLIFEHIDGLRQAKELLAAGLTLLRFGAQVANNEQDVRRLLDPLLAARQRDADVAYSSVHYVRIAGDPLDYFSHVEDGQHDPTAIGPHITDPIVRDRNLRALQARDSIERDIAEHGWAVVDRSFSTQTTDPMFMEPEAGLAWMDGANGDLHIVVGTQSPHDDREDIAYAFGATDCPYKGSQVCLKACYPGGGFGGRDKSSFPMYLALAAVFSDAPVRLAYDRFEQFLCGIKRHASAIRATLAYDAEGKPQALQSTILMDGGGEPNLTGAVVGLAALHAAGPYRIPRTVISARGVHTTGAPAGSMRGFGIPQATLAIDCLMDEAAERLGIDPIEYRARHALQQGDKDLTGMTLDHHLANVDLCRIAGNETLWVNRNSEKAKRDRPGLTRYGVGFACCMEAYGTSSDAAFSEVVLRADGTLLVRSCGVDMGQGSATAIAIGTVGTLGNEADKVEMGEVEAFETLGLIQGQPGGQPTNSHLTPKIANSSSASITAFHHLHALEEACKVVFDHGILPAAKTIWGSLPSRTTWINGCLTADGYSPLPMRTLAERAYASQHVVAAMVHTYFQHDFATACFEVDGHKVRRMIDALAVTRGGASARTVLDRVEPSFPPIAVQSYRRTLYASAGHLIALQIHLPTGRVQVLDAITILDAGDVHHEALLGGQVEGGFAMGLGYALLEFLPAAPGGVDGQWNLHRYQVPRAKHIPLGSLQLRLVPLNNDSVLVGGPIVRKKGIAEATMTTVAPAVLNAIAHAIGVRINSLPVTSEKLLEAMRSQ
jgi:CO/xanthine dehydrogenase Mo-binding subunit